MHSSRNPNDIATGIFLILVALIALYLSWPLDRMSSFGLGPGYVPQTLAVILAAFGLAIAIQGYLGGGEVMERWHLRPLLLVLGSVTFFGMAVERLGFFVALFGLVLIASAADRRTKLYQAIALATFAAAFSFLVFIEGIGLTIPLWPTVHWGQ
jgi:hypothetical protein